MISALHQERRSLAFRLGETYLPLLLSAAAAATWAVYLGYTALVLRTPLGFPLDDSWIHQTFARQLAADHRFYYNPGEPSTASTAPLWTLLLAVGYRLPLDYRLWAYGLGLLFLVLAAWTTHRLCGALFARRPGLALAAALGTALEWHLAWSGLSGMETPLFTFLTLVLLCLALDERASALLVGVVGGLGALARPEAVILLALVLFARLAAQRAATPGAPSLHLLGGWLGFVLPALLAFFLLVAPYLIFNRTVTGQLLPSTFYAKGAAYASALSPGGIIGYWAQAAVQVLTGPLLLLMPGLAYGALRAVGKALSLARQPARPARLRGRNGEQGTWNKRQVRWVSLVWLLVLPAVYALRLPATYHHGRYLMPLLPLLVIYGLWGTGELLRRLPLRRLAATYALLVVAAWLALWANGAVVFGWDVRFINEEEVAVALWLRDRTPADALVATHDVGAIAYFGGRRVLDTAGLVTPELAPYVRDQRRLLAYVAQQQADYLAIFPRWYPLIVADARLQEVFRLRHDYAIAQGADNMVVFRPRWQDTRDKGQGARDK